ncbi:MAG: DUF1653 domain-containing protein [bacterium]
MHIPEKGFYYHFKHNPDISISDHAYEIIGVSKNTEDESASVVYRPLYTNDWYKDFDFSNRPLSMFIDKKELNGEMIPRFQKITDPEIIAKLAEIRNVMYK